jgi:hypothetical protein
MLKNIMRHMNTAYSSPTSKNQVDETQDVWNDFLSSE